MSTHLYQKIADCFANLVSGEGHRQWLFLFLTERSTAVSVFLSGEEEDDCDAEGSEATHDSDMSVSELDCDTIEGPSLVRLVETAYIHLLIRRD